MGGFIPWTNQRNIQHQLVAGSSSSSSSSSPKMSLTQYAAYFAFDAFCNLSIPTSSPISLRLILPSGVERLYGGQRHSHGQRDSSRKDECTIRVLDPEFFQTVLTKQDVRYHTILLACTLSLIYIYLYNKYRYTSKGRENTCNESQNTWKCLTFIIVEIWQGIHIHRSIWLSGFTVDDFICLADLIMYWYTHRLV